MSCGKKQSRNNTHFYKLVVQIAACTRKSEQRKTESKLGHITSQIPIG